jgi:hypothetical protein
MPLKWKLGTKMIDEIGEVETFERLCLEVGINSYMEFYTWDELMSQSPSNALARLSIVEMQYEKLESLISDIEIKVDGEGETLKVRKEELIEFLTDTSKSCHPNNISKTDNKTTEDRERLSDFLKNHKKRGVIIDDNNPALKQLSLRYEHYLYKYKKQIIDLTGVIDIPFDRLINQSTYLDSIIKLNPKAVLARGFLFMLAQCVHHQKVEPGQLMKFISVTNLFNDDEIKFLAKRSYVIASGADMNEKVDKIMDWLKEHGSKPEYSDSHSNGFHMNYLMLPAFDCNVHLIELLKTDLNGKLYTDDQAKTYLTSIDSKPFLAEDFGYKRIISSNELLFDNQFNIGKICHDVFDIDMFDYNIDSSDQTPMSPT